MTSGKSSHNVGSTSISRKGKNMPAKKKVGTHNRNGKKYTCCLIKEHGNYPVVVRKHEIMCLCGEVPARGEGSPKLNPNNPRIMDSVKNPNLTSAGQKRISKELDKCKSDVLSAALKRNGGQIEHLVIWKNMVIEGNRRKNCFKDYDGMQTIFVVIFPDDTPEELVKAYERTIHVAGKEEWASMVKSKLAYDLYHQTGDWRDVKEELLFKNLADAKNYVAAYDWLCKAQDLDMNGDVDLADPKQWSKFHHATGKILRKFFGYDEVEEKFTKPENFEWFCKLIRDGKLKDCRQSDGIVRPICALANEDPEDDTYLNFKKLLETEGAEKTWTKWKQYKEGNRISSQLNDLAESIQYINKAKTRCEKYKNDKMVHSRVLTLIATLEEFSQKIADN